MDIDTALMHLELQSHPPMDVLEELFEERCFAIRDYFLRNPVVPELYESRRRRLQRIAEAAGVLGLVLPPPVTAPVVTAIDATSLVTILRSFEDGQRSLRLQISSTLHPLELNELGLAMERLQTDYEERFMEATTKFTCSEAPVKAAEHLDTGRLLQWIGRQGLSDLSDQDEPYTMIVRERRRINDRRARGHRH